MCGISGAYSLKRHDTFVSSFVRATNRVDYRGPDGYGMAYFGKDETGFHPLPLLQDIQDGNEIIGVNLALGHRRLAIIDLSSNGAQPMPNSEQSVWITFNGEIYNYIELREELKSFGHHFRSESDTEVILAAYAEWGEECVNRFNGIWAFAIVDLNRQTLFCSRDRLGVKPFHYYHDGNHFVFGSEIKQLLCYPFVPRQVNERAVYEYLLFGAVDYNEETFFTSIYKLLQGCNLKVDLRDGSVAIRQYYQPRLEKNLQITYKEAAGEFRRLLTDSVRLQLRSDVEVGSCLSGGLDSSSIVCLMRDALLVAGKADIQRTFSSHFEEEEANELEYMNAVIDATGVQADFVYPTGDDLLGDLRKMVWHQEEPFGSTSIFAQWAIFKHVHQQGVKVMLDGQGADEMLAGYVGLYPYYFKQLSTKKQRFSYYAETLQYAKLHKRVWPPLENIRLWKGISRGVKPDFRFRTDWLNQDFASLHAEESIYQKTNRIEYFNSDDHLENILYQMTFINNLQSLLRHEDRNSMAFSVEGRVPFLDHRLVEFVFSLPSDFKIRGGYTKRVLRDGMKGILPDKIRWRVKKLGFATPERKWQQTFLKPLIETTISETRLRKYILPKQALDYYHSLSIANVTDFAPWRWLNISLWMDEYELG